MRPRTLLRLALAGTRTDTVRVLLTGVSAALATLSLLVTATVLAIPGLYRSPGPDANADQYRLDILAQPGLRPGVVLALVLLTIPMLALAGQSAQLGAPAREQRLAAIRLAGATPRQAVLVAAAETGVASLLGAGSGLAAYLVGRVVAHRPDPQGQLLLPTDQLPAVWAVVAICAGLPLLAATTAAALLRRVAFTPFGVLRRQRTRAPKPWPGLLIVVGVGLFVGPALAPTWLRGVDVDVPTVLVGVSLFGGALVAALGVVLGTGWISYTAGRVCARFARRPALLLAARRLRDDPWSGSRTMAALLVAVLFGAGAAGVRAGFVAQNEVELRRQRQFDAATGQDSGGATPDDFFLNTMDLVDAVVLVAVVIAAAGMLVAVTERILSRRRAYAALVATGVPRRVLGRAATWQALLPAVPAVLLALAVGVTMSRGVIPEARMGRSRLSFCDAPAELCNDPATAAEHTRMIELPATTMPVPVPYGQLALLGAAALLAVLGTVAVALLFLRPSTDVTELRTS